MATTEIPLNKIKGLPEAQFRSSDPGVKSEYAKEMNEGMRFPPVVVFQDKGKFILADGFQRVEAARSIECTKIAAEIREPYEGETAERSAILYAAGANVHGARRTIQDKRNAVCALLTDPEWSTWTNRQIAKQCRVSHTFVDNLRAKLDKERERNLNQKGSGQSGNDVATGGKENGKVSDLSDRRKAAENEQPTSSTGSKPQDSSSTSNDEPEDAVFSFLVTVFADLEDAEITGTQAFKKYGDRLAEYSKAVKFIKDYSNARDRERGAA